MGAFFKNSCEDRDKEISERNYRNRFDIIKKSNPNSHDVYYHLKSYSSGWFLGSLFQEEVAT